jgi:1-acyl-sn-glycerol-3-phosphate acyltransferase
MMNPITIDRKNATRSTQQIVRQGRERKSHGFWITVFPEGTRIAPGERGKYKLGAARMSKMLDMPLVPVAHNAGEFWPRNAFLKHPGLITVVIGAAVSAEQYPSADQQMAQVEEWIEARQDEIGGVGPCAPQSLRERRAHSEPA